MENHTLIQCFDTKEGRRIYDRFLACVEEHEMHTHLKKGVLLGFSGGADSVLCAALLLRLKTDGFDFPILLCHVNHGIRQGGAEKDQAFCEYFATRFGFELHICSVDVPKEACIEQIGVEECARNMRYSEFRNIISGRDDIKTIVTAHNATDNLETVVHRLFRGTGMKGLCGIPAVRQNIVRPMLYIPKKDIVNFLNLNNISFVTDESNFDCKYTRNYIRNEIFPHLERLTDTPEESIHRLVQNLREDEEYLNEMADQFLCRFSKQAVSISAFSELHRAIKVRVLTKMLNRISPELMLERGQIDAALAAVDARKRRQTLVGGFVLNCERDWLYVSSSKAIEAFKVALPLNQEVIVPQINASIMLCDRQIANSFLNVYKNSIQVFLSSDIIKGELCARNRMDGDSYAFGGVTHRLKTILNSLHLITPSKERIPVFCDEDGIVFVPPFLPRGQRKPLDENNADRILIINYPKGTIPWIDK